MIDYYLCFIENQFLFLVRFTKRKVNFVKEKKINLVLNHLNSI